ncbi:hypothetical protein ACQY0O_000505 [Thecaphora frezii]
MSLPASCANDYSVHLCTSAAQLRQAHRIRCQVFVEEQGYDLEAEIDQYDPVSAHFVLVRNGDPGKAVGVLRLVPYPLPLPKQDARAVEPNLDSFPLGGSQTEASTASHFTSAVFATRPTDPHSAAAHDPTLTNEEQQQTRDLTPKLGGAKLGRLALLEEARGKGLAQKLVREAEAWLYKVISQHQGERQGAFGPSKADAADAARGGEQKVERIMIKLSSQEYIQSLYRKLDYTAVGDVYLEEGQPHVLMYKEIVLNAASG